MKKVYKRALEQAIKDMKKYETIAYKNSMEFYKEVKKTYKKYKK